VTKEVAPIMAGAVVSVAAENGQVIRILTGKGMLLLLAFDIPPQIVLALHIFGNYFST